MGKCFSLTENQRSKTLSCSDTFLLFELPGNFSNGFVAGEDAM